MENASRTLTKLKPSQASSETRHLNVSDGEGKVADSIFHQMGLTKLPASPQVVLNGVRRVLRVRNTFGRPGASLTWGVRRASESELRAGLKGEQLTGDVLNTIAKRSLGFYVFHSIGWPAGGGDTDHAVIKGNKVFIIDSKMWKNKRTYVVNSRGTVLRGTVRFEGGKLRTPYALEVWRKILPKTCEVVGIVCISQDEVWIQRDKNWENAPFKLVTLKELPRVIRSMTRSESDNLSLAGELASYYMMTHLIKPQPSHVLQV